MTTQRPANGRAKHRGDRKKSGPPGRTGPAQPTTREILEGLDKRFVEIQRQLDVQVTRSGQLQAEVDRQRRDTEAITEHLKQVQADFTKFLKTSGG